MRAQPATATVQALLWGLLLAGLLSSLIALVQVFAPSWPDGNWIARATSAPPRAGANLRQPNHLSSLLLWSLIALIGLRDSHALMRRPWWLAALVLLCLSLVLTGSRTGVLGVLMLAAWGLVDRRLTQASRVALALLPLLYAALWFSMVSGSHALGHEVAAEGRASLAGSGDISSSRFAIWSNTLALMANEPLLGVGFGEFNLAWTLTAFAARPTAFFDHTHNLPLQLLVEFGIPVGTLLIALLALALAQAALRAWRCTGEVGVAKRAALMIVLMIGLHSMLEYPLWYAYFLLPAAFAWGFALAPPPGAEQDTRATEPTRPRRAMALAGMALSIGAAAAVLDYRNVVVIYDPPDDAVPLETRVARGQRSLLFGHHADYAAATAFGPPKAPLSLSQQLALRRAPHQLLDVRLLIAWSQALAAQGELDKARWLAARIREFHNSGADDYFAPCADTAQATQAF
ncbi:MAG TPA: Wzy polymerase domain-containing protein, partial [Polyangiales bacterium]